MGCLCSKIIDKPILDITDTDDICDIKIESPITCNIPYVFFEDTNDI